MMTNKMNTTIYTGVTNNLIRRVIEHKSGQIEGFTKRYRLHKLVFFEETHDVNAAIAREKQIKAGSRQKKIELIEAMNPNWDDMYDSFWTE
jgi:putative endonuclease